MADSKKATKKNMSDAIYEALTSKKTLDDIIKSNNYEAFKISKSDVKFLVNNLGFIQQQKISDLTDEGLQKVKSAIGKRKFQNLITVEDATAVITKVTQEYQKLSGTVGDKVKSATKAAKGKKK